jgi:hypothetical protein
LKKKKKEEEKMFIILFFISTVYAVITPNCSWVCDAPICPAVCEARCEPPVCNTNCPATCNPPICFNLCSGVNQSAVDACPTCETSCLPLQCNPVNASCQILCQAPSCGWYCSKPSLSACPAPICQLQCEQAFCESSGIRLSVGLLFLVVFLAIF